MSVLMCSCQGIDHGRTCIFFGVQMVGRGLLRDQESLVVEGRPQVRLNMEATKAQEAQLIGDVQAKLSVEKQWNPHAEQKAFMGAEAKERYADQVFGAVPVNGPAIARPRASALGLRLRRANLIQYLYDKVSAADWHAVSDAANDLRELDIEIRMTEDREQGNRTTPTG